MIGARVQLERVGRRYGEDAAAIIALADVDLEVAPGTVVAITGPSGSGKSTLLHLVGAMDGADEGRIVVDDVDVTALERARQPAYRRTIGFVFQRFHLLAALTALDNVAAPLLPYRTSFDKFDRARELLAAVGLAGREGALPAELSGGEQQRVAIARALVNEPKLLLADEPTGNVDSATGTEIMNLLLDLRTQRSMTILVVTHNHALAARCDRVVRLQDGRVVDAVDVPPAEEPAAVLARISRVDAQT